MTTFINSDGGRARKWLRYLWRRTKLPCHSGNSMFSYCKNLNSYLPRSKFSAQIQNPFFKTWTCVQSDVEGVNKQNYGILSLYPQQSGIFCKNIVSLTCLFGGVFFTFAGSHQIWSWLYFQHCLTSRWATKIKWCFQPKPKILWVQSTNTKRNQNGQKAYRSGDGPITFMSSSLICGDKL